METPPTTEAPPAPELVPYIEALREKWSALPDWELAFAARTVLEVHDEPGKLAEFAHVYKGLVRRHTRTLTHRVERLQNDVERFAKMVEKGVSASYEARALAHDLIILAERLCALEAIKEFEPLFAEPAED